MSLYIRERLLHGFIQSMYDEGIVNDRFYQLQTMDNEYVMQLVMTYCLDSEIRLERMTHTLDQPIVNFALIGLLARRQCAESINIGAEYVSSSCAEIVWACNQKNLQCCLQAFNWTKNSYSELRRKFKTVVEGIINDQFPRVQLLRSVDRPDSVGQFIYVYCHEVDAIICELIHYIDLPEVVYSRLAMQACKIEEKSIWYSLGAEHMRLACSNLIQACNGRKKETIMRELLWMKNEFDCTRKKLESLAQMEKRIIRLQSKQEGMCSCAGKSVDYV